MFRHPQKPQFLIKIGGEAEAIETFILACAKEAGIDLSLYGLEPDLESLKAKTKNTDSVNDPQLRLLFQDLAKTGEVARLKMIIKYLVEKQSDSEILVVKRKRLRCNGTEPLLAEYSYNSNGNCQG